VFPPWIRIAPGQPIAAGFASSTPCARSTTQSHSSSRRLADGIEVAALHRVREDLAVVLREAEADRR